MIKINRTEADMLREKGLGKAVKMASITHKSRQKTYYAVEEHKVMDAIQKYRESIKA